MKNLVRIFLILTVVILPHVLPLPFFSFSIIVIASIWLFLKYDRSGFADLGFSLSRFKKKAVLYGTLTAIAVVAITQFVTFPLIDLVFDFPDTEVDLYNELEGNTGFYLMMLVFAWLIGGFYEEIVFRGFIFTQFKHMFGEKYRIALSFMLTSILFGLYHLQLGPADTINALLVGMGYHFLVLKFKGNLWYSIICHGTYNTIVMTLLYLGKL